MACNPVGKPAENGVIEAFNGKPRDECLNVNQFLSLEESRSKIEAWRVDYSPHRPQPSLGELSPIHERSGIQDEEAAIFMIPPEELPESGIPLQLPELKQSVLGRFLQRARGGRTPVALFDQGLVSGANVLTGVLLARAFGIREYGVFVLAWTAVLFANSLQYALIVTPMMSVGPKQEPEERSSYFGAVLLQEIVFALLATVIMFISVRLATRYFPQWEVGNLALPLSGATLAYLLQDFLRRYFFCIGRSKRALATDAMGYLSQLPILIWILHGHGTKLSSVLWIIAATSFIGFAVCMPWYERITLDAHSFRRIFLRHWRISRWLFPTAFMQWGAGNIFLIAAPVYYGAVASAVLRAATNIVGVAHVWFLGLENVVPAKAARLMRLQGLEGMLRYIKGVFLLWGGVTLVFTSIVACFPSFWLQLFYGTKYSSDGSVLRLNALLYVFVFISRPLCAGLQALEYTAPIFWAYPAMIAFSVALAGPFARTLGLNGVLLGMCGVQLIFQGIIGTAFWLRVRQIRRTSASESLECPQFN
jgi:O-antigen/teichoic acid export membrane protein